MLQRHITPGISLANSLQHIIFRRFSLHNLLN
nr:MAG TPA: hypothetical protein [Caudoviricetes sp.]